MKSYIAFTEEYLIRFIIQTMMLIIYNQASMDTHTILKQYFQRLIIQHKAKFKHYIYDLGLRNVIAVTLFTFGICFSVIVPIVVPIMALLCWLCVSIQV